MLVIDQGDLKTGTISEYYGVFIHDKNIPFDINNLKLTSPYYASSIEEFLRHINSKDFMMDFDKYNLIISKFQAIGF